MKTYQTSRRDRGATAIFVVMFASLLFLVMSVGFIRLMVQEQTRSTDSELSRSAYDAALSGVEDGKRVLSYCLNSTDVKCDEVKSTNTSCSVVQNVLGIGDSREVLLKSGALGDSGESFDQAYTCVRINRESPDYQANIPAEPFHDVVYMRGVRDYTKIRLSWFSRENLGSVSPATPLSYAPLGDKSLLDLDAWGNASGARPQIMRATYITDTTGVSHEADDKTLYLFPRNKAPGPDFVTSFTLDNRRSGGASNLISAPVCISTFNNTLDEYACSATLTIPSATRSSYLYLASPYGAVDYKVELIDSSDGIVNFDGVQPTVDATGRAGDVFRRVRARVEQSSGGDARNLYPRASIDITNNFCKAFAVGTTNEVYNGTISDCDPTRAGD